MKRLLFAILALFLCILVKAQTRKITGKVSSAANAPLAGVTVQAKGTQLATATDAEGNFALSVQSQGTVILVFSYIGFESKEVSVTGADPITVALTEKVQGLNDVVVVGYGTARKRDLTGSVASVNAKDLDKTPVIRADQMLQGRVSGLQFTQTDGQPGSVTSIRIRGTNSINSGNEPLYVIDGFAGAGDLNSINPGDIQSIEVLKDASATAIYGSRGANGVILVTTKKGSAGQNSVTVDGYNGIQKVAKKLKMMNAKQFGIYLDTLQQQNNALNPASALPLPYTADQINSLGSGTDWQDALYRVAPIQNYQLGFTGGNSDTRYYLSFNYFSQDGIMRNTGFQRGTIRMNLDKRISDKLKVGFSSQLAYTSQLIDVTKTDVGYGAAGAALAMSPATSLRDSTGAYTYQNQPLPYVSVIGNPVAGIVLANDRIGIFRGLVNVFGEYEIIPGLRLRSSIGVDYSSSTEKRYIPTTTYLGAQTTGSGYAGTSNRYSWLNENTLTYSRKFNESHAVDIVGGFSLQAFDTSAYSSSSTNYFTNSLGSNNLAIGGNVQTPTNSGTLNTLASYFGRINYRLKEKYLFTFTMRADGSSRFGTSHKWGYFPSGAFAWRMSDESFIKDIRAISDLKLRTSYGVTGNQEIGSYQSLSQYTTNGYALGSTPVRAVGITPNNIANPNLHWESTAAADAGVDLSLWSNRVTLTADYYYKTTSNLLLNVAIPQSSGYASILLNAGKVRNQGFELSITSRNMDGPRFKWSTTLNYAANRNKVLNLNGTDSVLVGKTGPYILTNGLAPAILIVGQPIGAFYGYKFKGIWQSKDQIAKSGMKDKLVPGDPIIADLRHDSTITGADKTIVGHAQPKFIYGMTNDFSLGRFNISVFLQGVYGNDILNVTKYSHTTGGTNNPFVEVTNAWSATNASNTIPRVNSSMLKGLGVVDNFIEKGSYLRIQTVTLSYNAPLPKITHVFKSSLIYFTVQNLYTITGYSGYNPEVSSYGMDNLSAGIDLNPYPPARTFIAGIKMTF
ncbi:TonB-dependent receptor [Flavitalea sp. BT771]|uniref:SusC/RagA family TonB-linked outer membrane protein n=1 Tax=Flavitalea sp. BT771 TaxID=3063329 RepID=UPI0026E28400|nr:TonB-dependent receptor [Flavitalea sp. BT771]MDO6434894.1 TonB-dependent receptor [Flavitalea sp. BT771]MDV6223794.1 TonB-dependent receptor [Flavitalea sp. BT771]